MMGRNKRLQDEHQKERDDGEAGFPWSQLPSELLNTVLAWLPLRALFRVRTVCKQWNSTISAAHFTHFPSYLPPSPDDNPWLIFFTPKSFDFLLAFDFAANSWFKFEMGFLPIAQNGIIWCTGSARGRLLLEVHSSLHVCNPLTKTLFALPPFKSIKLLVTQGFATAHIKNDAALRRQNDYTVLVIGNSKAGLVIEAYLASRNSWDVVGSLPSSFVIKHDQMLECNGLFYSLLLKPNGILVIGEEDEEGSNWRIQALPVVHQTTNPRLLACQNALFMVCSIYDNLGFDSILIWRFRPDERDWIMLDNMPDTISGDVRAISFSNWVDCVGVGKFICFRALCSPKVLSYDLCDDTWSWLPDLPQSFDTVLTRGFQFEPRLITL